MKSSPPLLELALTELVIPLKVTHAGRTYRVRHVLRPPRPADWFAYEAALQLAVEELPSESSGAPPDSAPPDSDEPSYRFQMRSTDAALLLWDRLLLRLEGYALPAPASSFEQEARDEPQSPITSSSGHGSRPELSRGINRADQAPTPADSGPASRVDTTPAGEAGGDSDSDWRDLVPLAHKEAAVRALTLVAPARLDPDALTSSNGRFPLLADEVPVTLEASRAGAAYPRLVHRFRPPSVEDELAYRRLLAENLVVRGTRRPRTLIPSRLPALVRLYDRLVLSVEGYAVNNRALASPADIARAMDAWHKRVAVQTLFGDLSADAASDRSPDADRTELSLSVTPSELPE